MKNISLMIVTRVHFKTKNRRKALLQKNIFMNINKYILHASLYILPHYMLYANFTTKKFDYSFMCEQLKYLAISE